MQRSEGRKGIMQDDKRRTRRDFIKSVGVIGGAAALGALSTKAFADTAGKETKALAKYGDACVDRSLLDTKFDGMVVSLDKWFADHPVAAGTLVRSDLIFESPRCRITGISNKGQDTGLYYRSATDEAVYVFRGKAEQYVNGEWKKIQAGDIYVVPRGVVQATKVAKGDELLALSFTAPPKNCESDQMSLKDVAPGTAIGDKSLIDTKYDKTLLFSLTSFFDTHPVEAGKQLRVDAVYQSPRSLAALITNPTLPPHYHTLAEEIVIAHKGSATMYINGKWTEVKQGEVHINPRGVIHGTKVLGPEGMQVATLFAPAPPSEGDRVFVELAL
jgi:quercetin dioxygenase-like cupin family protein